MIKKTKASMEFTGERFLPTETGDIELEHTHRYLVASEFVQGKSVLDIASGEGYGSALLAQHAKRVTGVDISQEAIAFSAEKYRAPNLEFKHGDCTAIPLTDASVDIVVSFETIEHHTAHDEMMAEIKRVLNPNGLLIISSPDKATYTEAHTVDNEFHVRELYRDEFEDLIDRNFENYLVKGQSIVYGSLLAGETPSNAPFRSYRNDADESHKTSGVLQAIYLVAFASDGPLPPAVDSAYSTITPPYNTLLHQLSARLENRATLMRNIASEVTASARMLSGNSEPASDINQLVHEITDDPAAQSLIVHSFESLRDEIKRIRTRLEASEAQVSQLQQTCSSNEESMVSMQQQVTIAKQHLDTLKQSHSWRLTSPLRVSANLTRSMASQVRKSAAQSNHSVPDTSASSANKASQQTPKALVHANAKSSSADPILSKARWLNQTPRDGRPRILILPGIFAVGGVERLTAAIMRQLEDRFRFVVVSNEVHTEQTGCLLDSVTQFSEAQFDLAAIAHRSEHLGMLSEITRTLPPDLVWICNGSVWFHQHVDQLLTLFADVPVIDQQVYDADAGWINHLVPGYTNRVSRIVAINAKIRDKFIEMGVAKEKIDLIYSAVDLDGLNLPERDAQIAHASNQKKVVKPRRVYAFVARFSEQKRPLDLVNAAAILANADAPIDILMIGDGPLAEPCKAQLRKSGISNVTVQSFSNKLHEVYARVDGIVFVSGYEGLPLVMLEALCSGVPVLATDVGDIRLVAEQLGGGCVVMDDAIGRPERIARSLMEFDEQIAEHQTDALRVRAAARERFGSETVAKHYFNSWASAWQSFAEQDLTT